MSNPKALEYLFSGEIKKDSSHLSHWKKAHYKATKNWLCKYKPVGSNPSNLEKVTGYIEALYHLYKLEDWYNITQILSINIDSQFPNHQFHNQLGI